MVVVEFCAGHAHQELGADADIKPVVHQRKRVVETSFEVVVGRDADVANVAVLAALEEFEERVGEVDIGIYTGIEVERPEILVVPGKSAEADDVDP